MQNCQNIQRPRKPNPNISIQDAQETYKNSKEGNSQNLLSELQITSFQNTKKTPITILDYEGLIAKKSPRKAHVFAIGDLNGDGNEDVFCWWCKTRKGAFSCKELNGSLTLKKIQPFQDSFLREDTAQGWIPIGDGKFGRETTQKKNLTNTYNISAIAPQDVDQDGDLDVFIGSRKHCGVYGMDPTYSFFGKSEIGVFMDASQRQWKGGRRKRHGLRTLNGSMWMLLLK